MENVNEYRAEKIERLLQTNYNLVNRGLETVLLELLGDAMHLAVRNDLKLDLPMLARVAQENRPVGELKIE